MIRSVLLASALLAGTQATALTCAPPDPLRSFRAAQDAPGRYVVLYGRLSFDPSALPAGRRPPLNQPEATLRSVPAQFDGFALGLEGFTRPVKATVELEPRCLGPFCGSIGPGEGWLLFAELTEPVGYRVAVDPCGAWAFDRVSEATLGALAGCLRGEACGAP